MCQGKCEKLHEDKAKHSFVFSSVTMIIVFQILFVTGVRDYQLKTSGGRQRSGKEMLKFWESIKAGLVY